MPSPRIASACAPFAVPLCTSGATFGTTYGPLMSEMVVPVIPQ